MSLIDAYIKALSELEEAEFQKAIVQRLLVAINNFQTVPTYPSGDGGLDGYSHKGTRAYCCYGLKYDAAKTPKKRAEQLASKFSSDLRRLFELEPDGKDKLLHKDNDALLNIFGALPADCERIIHVTLIANWFENNAALGPINVNTKSYAASSKCRWVSPTVDVVLKGPKEFVDQYGVDEASMLWLHHKDFLQKLDQEAASIEVPEGPTFDSKMATAETLCPDATSEIQQLADLLRKDWQWAIAFERQLSDRVPPLHAALERGQKQLLRRVLTHKSLSPWEAIEKAQQFGEEVFTADFEKLYGAGLVRDLASGEVARLIGSCPINWKVKDESNGS